MKRTALLTTAFMCKLFVYTQLFQVSLCIMVGCGTKNFLELFHRNLKGLRFRILKNVEIVDVCLVGSSDQIVGLYSRSRSRKTLSDSLQKVYFTDVRLKL